MSIQQREIWRNRRNSVRIFLVGIFGFLPFSALVAVIFREVLPSVPAMLVIAPWIIVTTVSGARLALFRCPRCERRFSEGRVRWTDRCSHCGLREGEEF